jgi:glycosyltransferase involved in cell wall biosynthesis
MRFISKLLVAKSTLFNHHARMVVTIKPRNILIVTAGKMLAPSSGGELRTHHLARELAALGHAVDLLALAARHHPSGAARPAPGLAIRQVHTLALDLAQAADRLRLIPITELPAWLILWRGTLRRLAAQKPYDIVQFESPWFARLYGAAGAASKVVYNSQNIESQWWGPQLERRPGGKFFQERLRRHELRAIRGAAGVAVCSQRDGAWMAEHAGLGSARLRVIPNGYDARALGRPTPGERERLRRELGFGADEKIALFVASHTPPNREAAQAIARTIVPATAGRQLREKAGPKIRFVIVGKVGEALEAPLPPALTRIGAVEDVRPWLLAADVGLNPMSSGSGSNLKLAEYCAAGLPVVTTEFGLRGFEALRPWLAVEPIEHFPAALARASGPNAIPEEALEPFSWAHAARQLAEFYETLLTT